MAFLVRHLEKLQNLIDIFKINVTQKNEIKFGWLAFFLPLPGIRP